MPVSRPYTFGLFLFGLSWLGFDHYRPWVNFHSELLAFAGLFCLIAGVLLYDKQRQWVVPQAPALLGLLPLLVWGQYASGLVYFSGDALLSSLYCTGFLVAVLAGHALGNGFVSQGAPGTQLTGLMHALWTAALISAGIGLAQWLNVAGALGMYAVQSDVGDRAMGNLGQANQLATLLLMGIVALAYTYERRLLGSAAFTLGLGFFTAVLVLTQSRAGMLSVMVLAAFLYSKGGARSVRWSRRTVLIWVACFFAFTFALPLVSELLYLGDLRGVSSVGSISQRWLLWKQVVSGLAQSPWFGYGWNQTAAAQAAGALAFPGEMPATYAHNLMLDLLAWTGVPLGLFLTACIAYWFGTRMWSSVGRDSVYAMACLLPLAVHSLLEYPFAYAYFLIAAGLMVGVVEAGRLPGKTVALRLRWVWAFWVICLATGSYLAYEYFQIEEDFRVVRFENLNLGATPAVYLAPRIVLTTQLGAMLESRRLTIAPGMSKPALDSMRLVAQRFNDNVPRFRYALALALNGDPQEAQRQLIIIRSLFGQAYYLSCLVELRRLALEKYPQLQQVIDLAPAQ
jgi:O-antigen ligase